MQKRRLRYIIPCEINIVPFLDILLVLLMIFMMIPTQVIQSFEVNLPNSTVTKNMINNNKFIITIEITKIGLYNLKSHKFYIKNISLNQLSEEINNIMHIHPDFTCLIAASKTIQYDEVIQILNFLSNTGIHSVGMITNPIYSHT